MGDLVILSGKALDLDLEEGTVAWLDDDALFDSDGDGDPTMTETRVLMSH